MLSKLLKVMGSSALVLASMSVLHAEKSGAYGEVGFQWANQSYTNTTKNPGTSGYSKNAEINSSAFGSVGADASAPTSVSKGANGGGSQAIVDSSLFGGGNNSAK
ncbi:hypothetical protein [Helicobacter cetorum]|uniref:hypothetical protein n=1 Tax=Helicobacter cetorum TaxID=138563 RepID=UPI000CF1AB70|nr:hypothetical protein [Helicobacter cetorum]